MISLRKGMTSSSSLRMLMPALVFFACASLSAAGGGAIAALCLLPAGLVIEATRGGDRKDPAEGVQDA